MEKALRAFSYDEHFVVPNEFEIIDFNGGLYSVATDINQQTDVETMDKEADEFSEKKWLC